MAKPLNIAIIGGGAAGMITAYLLDKAGHSVTVYEREEVLGGNIRTANKNLQIDGLPDDVFLEAGVVEFPEAFTQFKRILDELGIERIPIPVGSALYPENGRPILSNGAIRRNLRGYRKWREKIRYAALKASAIPLWITASRLDPEKFPSMSMAEVLRRDGLGKTWITNFNMYSYSIPFVDCSKIPAGLSVPALRHYIGSKWFRIEGGVYSYIEAILSTFKGRVRCGDPVDGIERSVESVAVSVAGERIDHDRVVIATPPDKVLAMLTDPTAEERQWFERWRENYAETIIHCDTSFYERYGIQNPSEFDFFETPQGWGYNAALNGLCAVKGKERYGLAYNLSSLIDPDKILHVQPHRTPLYTAEAFAFRESIIQNNGANNTFFAGAYLGDGLHEGATVSALRVRDLIGQQDSSL